LQVHVPDNDDANKKLSHRSGQNPDLNRLSESDVGHATPTDTEPVKSRSPWRRAGTAFVGCVISAFFLWLLLRGLSLDVLVHDFSEVEVSVLAISLIPLAFSVVVLMWRSAILLKTFTKLTKWPIAKSLLISLGGNNVLPLRLGELLRVDYLSRTGRARFSSCLAVVAVERILDSVVLFLFFAAIMAFALSDSPDATAIIAVGALSIGGFLAIVAIARRPDHFVELLTRASRPLGKRINDFVVRNADAFAEGLTALSTNKKAAAVFFFSVAFWVVEAGLMYLWLIACRVDVPPYSAAMIIVFIAFGSLIPAAPAGIGVYHYFAARALSFFGVSPERAAVAAIVAHAMGTMPITIVSLPAIAQELMGAIRRR
jgi:glycosyltransferase 2 family protein